MNKHILTVNARIVYKVIIKRLETKRKFEQSFVTVVTKFYENSIEIFRRILNNNKT